MAGYDSLSPIYADGTTSDLILHGGQNGDFIYQTVFTMEGPREDMAQRVMASMMIFLTLIAYV